LANPTPHPDPTTYTNPPAANLDNYVRGRINHWIRVTGQTQTAVSERIGRNQVWLSRYLRGEYSADLDTLALIAEAFDLTLHALLAVPADRDEAALLDDFRALPQSSRRLARQLIGELARPRAPRRGAR
jgi:transcriptional regulator with XRE-family HTH domain